MKNRLAVLLAGDRAVLDVKINLDWFSQVVLELRLLKKRTWRNW